MNIIHSIKTSVDKQKMPSKTSIPYAIIIVSSSHSAYEEQGGCCGESDHHSPMWAGLNSGPVQYVGCACVSSCLAPRDFFRVLINRFSKIKTFLIDSQPEECS